MSALKQAGDQGLGVWCLTSVIYSVTASMPDVGMMVLEGIYFHSDTDHVVLFYWIAKTLVEMAESSFIVLYGTDLAAARVMVDDRLGEYSHRPEVVRSGFSEAWVKSLFFKQPLAAVATPEDEDQSDDGSM